MILKRIAFLLPVLFLSACYQPPASNTEKQRLLNSNDLVNLGCKSTTSSDLEYETGGVPFLSNELSVVYNGFEKCGFYLHLEVTEMKLGFIGNNNVKTTLMGASVGLKLSDTKLETREPESKYKKARGEYLEVYNGENKYLGFIYASQKGPKSMMAIALGFAKQHQATLLDLINTSETRNYNTVLN